MKLKKETDARNLWAELEESETDGLNYWVVVYRTPRKLTKLELELGLVPERPGQTLSVTRKVATIKGADYHTAPYVFEVITPAEYEKLWQEATEGKFPESVLGDEYL